jgi:hypothetical protein
VHRARVDRAYDSRFRRGLVIRTMVNVMRRRVAMMIEAHAGGRHLPVELMK